MWFITAPYSLKRPVATILRIQYCRCHLVMDQEDGYSNYPWWSLQGLPAQLAFCGNKQLVPVLSSWIPKQTHLKLAKTRRRVRKQCWNPMFLVLFLFWKKTSEKFQLQHTTPSDDRTPGTRCAVRSSGRVCLVSRIRESSSKFHCNTVAASRPG